MHSIVWLANILAFLVAFFATPLAYGESITWVQTFTARHYGTGFEESVAIAWFGIIAGGIFFGTRASLSTGLIMASMRLATRIL